MKSIHYSLSSNAYKTNIFAGFSQLQKQEEFVDLTLAADGHLVQVHKNLIALASPYLKEILKSMSHHSPVIFLNNVSHDILTYLLNYIYLGEVNIPVNSVDAFIEVSKSLHITGIEDLEPPPKIKPTPNLTKKRRKPSESRANIAIHKSQNDTINVQQLPTDSNNDDFSKKTSAELSMENEKQSDIISNAKFIIQQDDMEQNQSCNVLQNVSLVQINKEHNIMETEINQNIHTDITDQNEIMDTNQIMPVIEITNTDQHAQANTNYKIVVKTGPSNNTEKSNMPVLEIQPITQEIVPQKQIPYCITTQAKQNLTLQEYSVQNVNLTGSDISFQEHTINETSPNIQMGMKQSVIEKDKLIKVLDKVVIKPGVNMLDGSNASSRISLESSIPLDCKMDLMQHMAQFSLTERGAIHMILNRYIYCCHHSTRNKCRWRCIEYRRSACKAFVDTIDGAIVTRKGLHAHPFHDKKIYKKHDKGLIFPTLELAMSKRDIKVKEGLRTLSIDEIDDDEIAMDE